MTKEKLKNEIRAEMADVNAKNNQQWKKNGTNSCNCNNPPVQDYNYTELSNMIEDKLFRPVGGGAGAAGMCTPL